MAKLVIDSSTLKAIADAIREKLGTTEKINPYLMDDRIRSIDTSGVTIKQHLDLTENASRLFYNYSMETLPNYVTYDLTENVTDVSGMFWNCVNLNDVPLLNTENATDMNYMFYNCKSLTKIPQINTNKATNISSMFSSCWNLEAIDITSMDGITSAYNAGYIASGCFSLKKFIIRNMTKVPFIGANPFSYCYHFLGTVSEKYNPDGLKDGVIYVPDAYVDQLKAADGWNTYADIIKPLSELVE